MTHQTAMTCVKTDPIFNEEQEDLIMYYLNSDYMSTTPCCNSSQSSNQHVSTPPTPRTTPTQGLSPISTPESEFRKKCIGMAPVDDWNNSPTTPSSNEYFRQQEFDLPSVSCVQPNILNDFPFMASPPGHEHLSPYFGSIENALHVPTLAPHYLLSQQPTSPNSFSSYSSSSDSEQLKKKRGRKKRDLPSHTSSVNSHSSSSSLNSGSPAMIAPAPVRPILPAYKPRNEPDYTNNITGVPLCENNHHYMNLPFIQKQASVKNEISSPKIASISDKAAVDSQKAATIAKRQERLIKNRAAALLSRKRKREHLTALEDQRKDLSNANRALQERVIQLEKENLDLQSKIKDTSSTSNSFERSSSDIISMMILCYFAFIVSFSSRSKPGLITALDYNAKLPFTLLERSISPLQLESYHQSQQEYDENNQEPSSKSSLFFGSIAPAQKTESKPAPTNVQKVRGANGLGRRREIKRLSSP